MTTQVLNVTLNDDGDLDVDQDGNGNQVAYGDDVTIQWQLTGNAASGTFNSMSATHPGFAWIDPPPPNVFGNVSPDGHQMTMRDNNTDPGGVTSYGQWVYQIYATIDGSQHWTTVSTKSPSATSSDPTIQNLSPT